MVWSIAWKELTDKNMISGKRASVYSFKKRINKGRKTVGIFIYSNLLAVLLGKFSIMTKQLQIYDRAREIGNFDRTIFCIESLQVRNVIVHILYKRRKVRAGFYFSTRAILLLTATWFPRSKIFLPTNISSTCFKILYRESQNKDLTNNLFHEVNNKSDVNMKEREKVMLEFTGSIKSKIKHKLPLK